MQLAHIPPPASPHYSMTLEEISNGNLSDLDLLDEVSNDSLSNDLELFSVSDVERNDMDDNSSDEHYEY